MESFAKPLRFGDYLLRAKIAQGGMAEVFMATSTKPELATNFIAIKKLLPHLNSNKAFVDLLIHEAKISVLLNHPGIVHVYDLGSYKSDFFIAMEYIHGKSLDRLLEKLKAGKCRKPSIELASYIILEVLKALSFAHQLNDIKGRDLNIIHRDISPGNILLSYSGDVKLADFGIATAAGRLQAGFTQTAMGKLVYMSPEQAVNDPVVRASDIYSLCVVYFELLTGQLPFQAENVNLLLKKVIDGRITDISVVGGNIPKELRDLISLGLNKSPRKRFQSCPELYLALVDFFKDKFQIDFSDKSTREAFRKKLTEYLRVSFESEIVQEIEIVQSALISTETQEQFKTTAPQDVKAVETQEWESTIVSADLSNEATRHFPLTQAERERILKGLPPEEALQSTGTDAARSSPAGSDDDIFFAPTIVDGSVSADSSAFRRISAHERLSNSSLRRDQKEDLTKHLPALEIVTAEDLDTFERQTFSGEVTDDAETRPRNREEILKEIEAIRVSETRLNPTLERRSDSARKSEPPKVSAAKERVSQSPSSGKQRKLAIIAGAVLSLAALSALGLFFGPQVISQIGNPFSTTKLLPTEKVHLRIIGEAQPDQQRRFKSVTVPNIIKQVTDFFNLEYTRYTGDVKPTLEISTSEPGVLISGLSKQSNAVKIMSSEELFEFLNISGFKRPADSKVVFVYLYPHNPTKPAGFSFPREYLGRRIQNSGAIFSAAHESDETLSSIHLARQIAALFGATDKRDPRSGLPLSPEGLADPRLEPLFPQTKAELMALEIALSPLEKKMPESLSELSIGPQTAYELGWISRSQLSELMP